MPVNLSPANSLDLNVAVVELLHVFEDESIDVFNLDRWFLNERNLKVTSVRIVVRPHKSLELSVGEVSSDIIRVPLSGGGCRNGRDVAGGGERQGESEFHVAVVHAYLSFGSRNLVGDLD